MAKQIHQLAGLTGNIANGDMFAVDTGTVTRKFTYGSLAEAIVEQYNGSTIGGKAQTLKAAIDALAGVLSDAEIRKIFTGNAIVASASGAGEIGGLMIYGKSVQSGTPTPSVPVDIVTAGESGTLPMVSAGKNLIDGSGWNGYTKNGLTCVVDDGAVTISGNAPSAVTLLYASKQSLAAGTYIISGGVSSNISVDLRDDNGAQISGAASTGSDTTFTLTNTRTDIWPCIRVAANASVSGLVIRPMVRPASVSDAAFAPYNGITAAIPTPNGLPGIPVASGGNYIDTDVQQWLCDTIDLEAGTWTKRCGVVTFNGGDTESWSASDSVAGRFYTTSGATPNARPYAYHLCTHSVSAPPRETTSVTGKSFFTGGGNFDINTSYSSVSDFKAALATNNMTLVYELNAPVVTQLTQAQITALKALKSFDGSTALFTTDDAQPDLRAKIFVNAGAYI